MNYHEQFPNCTQVLRAQGLAYPRTCHECGLGPCKRLSAIASSPAIVSNEIVGTVSPVMNNNPEQPRMPEPVMWRASAQIIPGKFMYFDHEPVHLKTYDPLYTIDQLREYGRACVAAAIGHYDDVSVPADCILVTDEDGCFRIEPVTSLTAQQALKALSENAQELGLDYVPAEGSRESRMVTVRRDQDGKPTVWCDPEIVDLVAALNDAGIGTVASCSGHGEKPGNIALADGRELIIASSYEEARRVEHLAQPPSGDAEDVRDAARYRWLRRHDAWKEYDMYIAGSVGATFVADGTGRATATDGASLDSAIDAAMLAREVGNG